MIVKLPRLYKKITMLSIDVVMIYLVLILSISLRLGQVYVPHDEMLMIVAVAPFIAIPIFIKFGLYRAIVRYIGFSALWAIIQAVSIYATFWGLAALMLKIDGFPRSVIIINFLFAMLFIGGTRMIARWYFSSNRKAGVDDKNIVIYGATDQGVQLSYVLNNIQGLNPVFFIDDNPLLYGHNINGLKVYSYNDLPRLKDIYDVDEVFLALPKISKEKKLDILNKLYKLSLTIKTVPLITDITTENFKINDFHKVDVFDLLGRAQVEPNNHLLKKNIKNKIVMVTGSGGSIGSELCRQIIKLHAKRLILYEQSEFLLYKIEQELEKFDSETNIIPILGSVTNKNRFERVCKAFNIQTIFHAAAYKHVPMVESNASEGFYTNIFGTLNCATIAANCNVNTFVLISTDKAVRPTNIMGATKRISELVVQSIAPINKDTNFSIVRFGNVLGSSGSVVPLFQQQIEDGGPVTVTDPKINRYFMTIPEAVELVIQAGSMGNEGDVFVLDMGDPVYISHLAEKMIFLSGNTIKNNTNPNGDIEIIYTGLRPGEKLYEELLISNNALKTEHPMILKENEKTIKLEDLNPYLDRMLNSIKDNDIRELICIVKSLVPGFVSQNDIVDILFNKEFKKYE